MNLKAMIEDARQNFALQSVIFGAGAAYLGFVGYAGVRSYDLMARTLPPDLIGFALLGVVVLELTALIMPFAIHNWAVEGRHRQIAYIFYGVDLLMIAANAILDSAHISGTLLPGVMDVYQTWFVPVMPIVVGAGWSLMFAADPRVKQHDERQAMKVAARIAVNQKVLNYMNSPEIEAMAEQQAKIEAGEIMGLLMSRPVASLDEPKTPSTPQPVTVVEVAPTTTPKVEQSSRKNGATNHA